MAEKPYPASFDADIRTDYVLIVIGVAAAVFAFMYLILV
jgi:hypothetical protein